MGNALGKIDQYAGEKTLFIKEANARLDSLLLLLFQENSQFRERFMDSRSAHHFFDANERRKIDTFESDSESIDIEGDARRTVQNRRHSTDEDEINLCPDQRRNDLPEINSHRDSVSAFCRRAAALQPFATCVNAFARVARKSV